MPPAVSESIIRPEQSPDWYSQSRGDLLLPEDNLLEYRLNGDLRIYETIDDDPYLGRLVDERRESPFRKDWRVEAASQKPVDLLAAELVRQVVKRFDFDDACGKLNHAIFTGRAIAEIEWEETRLELKPKKSIIKRTCLIPKDICARDASRLIFALSTPNPTSQFVKGFEARQLTMRQPSMGEPLPVNSVIIHSHGSMTGNPYGKGIYQRLYWLNQFKRQVLKLGLPALEAKALPYITFDGSIGDEDLKKAKDAVAQFYKLGWMALPEGVKLNFLERFHTGRLESIRQFLEWFDAQAATAIVGQTLTSKTADSADRGNTQIHYQVGEDRAKSDADLLSSTLRTFLFVPLTQLNIPGATAPSLYRNFEQPIDLLKQSEVDRNLAQIGYKRSIDSVKEIYGDGFEESEPNAISTNDSKSKSKA
jgi:phage gp29-like protein